MILCLLCFFVALSFVAPLLPIASATSSTMPCCTGKAGHCDSGLGVKRVPPPPAEPMCGLKGATVQDDGIPTIVADPIETEAPHSHSHYGETSSSTAETHSNGAAAAASASLSKACRMDCGACLAGLNRQDKRDRILVPTFGLHSSTQPTSARFEYQSVRFSSNDDWKQTSPRGPPAVRL